MSLKAFELGLLSSKSEAKEKTEDNKKIEDLIYKESISNEYKRVENDIFNSAISNIEKKQKMTSLDEWLDESMKNSKKYTEIPELILRHMKSIKKSIREFCTRKAINKVITQTNLPHEAFHYFYETKFAKEGYEGPKVNELLIMAIRRKQKRFGDNDPGYASISYFLKGININNFEQLSKFCKNITNSYDTTSKPKEYSQKEWDALSNEEKDKWWLQKSFFGFLNEYLARIKKIDARINKRKTEFNGL